MPRYSTAQARQRLAELLDAAQAGHAVIIERRGQRFRLRADGPRPRRRAARSRVRIDILDPAVAKGEWTWEWNRRGVRFARRRPAQ